MVGWYSAGGGAVTERPGDSLRVMAEFLRSAHEPLDLVSTLFLLVHSDPSTAEPTASVFGWQPASLVTIGWRRNPFAASTRTASTR